MDISLFLKGLIIGFSIAAPVGPIGVLCIQRTIAYGRASGFLTGLGAATADGFYGAIAGFGLTVISTFLVGQQFWLGLIGGMFLFYLGTKTFLSKPAEKAARESHEGLLSYYLSTVFLTATNPVTILSFAAIFAGLGLGDARGDILSAITMVFGVVIGSTLWWLLLVGVVGSFRTRLNISVLGLVNKFSGIVILVFAILALMSAFGLL